MLVSATDGGIAAGLIHGNVAPPNPTHQGPANSSRGNLYASTALMDPMSKAFVADIHHFIDAHGLELTHFGKGQRKDDVTQRLLASFTAGEGVLYVGRAQEKSNVWRTQRRYHPDERHG